MVAVQQGVQYVFGPGVEVATSDPVELSMG